MALYTPVPSETEPTSLIDLVNDARAVAGTMTRSTLDRLPLERLPFGFGAMPVEITDDLLVTVAGLEDY